MTQPHYPLPTPYLFIVPPHEPDDDTPTSVEKTLTNLNLRRRSRYLQKATRLKTLVLSGQPWTTTHPPREDPSRSLPKRVCCVVFKWQGVHMTYSYTGEPKPHSDDPPEEWDEEVLESLPDEDQQEPVPPS